MAMNTGTNCTAINAWAAKMAKREAVAYELWRAGDTFGACREGTALGDLFGAAHTMARPVAVIDPDGSVHG